MKTSLKLSVLLCAFSWAASGAIVPRTPEYVCQRLNPVDLRYECLREARDRFVDHYACGVIDRYESSPDTLLGMRAIAGGRFQLDVLEVCDRYTQSPATNGCLWAARDRVFDPSAVRACDRIQGAEETTTCLYSIADCSFSASEIAECDRYPTADATTACFRYYCR